MIDTSLDVKHVPKIYYGQYPFKIVVHGNQWFHDAVRFQELHKWLSDNTALWGEYITIRRKALDVYFRDIELAQKFTTEFQDIIKDVYAPYNKEIWEHLVKGDYDCREKLYFGKYRYRMDMMRHWRTDASETGKIVNVVNSIYKQGVNRVTHSRSLLRHILYTNEKHDIAKIKLVLNETSIRDLKVCKLYSETTET